MEGENRSVLQEKLASSLAAPIPQLTRRNIRLPGIKGKALAVIGMRRSGKTCFLWQCLRDRLDSGAPRDSLVYLNFEDERLSHLRVDDLTFLLDEYYRLHPAYRENQTVTFFLDEIQLVPGWETFARRVLDTENIQLFLSGSSALMLSKEVATSMRGRAMEVLVFPFSFREALAHRGLLPEKEWTSLPKAKRSALEKAFTDYLQEGGFPEAQGTDIRDRRPLLQGYVDLVVLRDIIERYGVSNPVALRWLQRQLLSNPCAPFSIQKFYDALKSQGIPVSKDTLHGFLSYFEDAFLIQTTSIFTASERQRMVNPRKAYPIDSGLIPIYERTTRSNLGHALETAVFIELLRRGYQVHYLRTQGGHEVDFHAVDPAGDVLLIQVCADLSQPVTLEREIRSLSDASLYNFEAKRLLLTLSSPSSDIVFPEGITVMPSLQWLLQVE